MTAEVGILSRNGVALAADSAVTVGSEGRKVYSSAEKLFQLAEKAPVGVMFYGTADLLGMPWETIVKTYRRQLGSNRFERLHDYMEDFLAFLVKSKELYPPAAQERFVRGIAQSYLRWLRESLETRLEDAIRQRGGGGISEDEVAEVIEALVQRELDVSRADSYLIGLDAGSLERVRIYTPVVDNVVGSVFGSLPMRESTRKNLIEAALEVLLRKRLKSSLTGLVVAGFGEADFYPRLEEVLFHGVAADLLLLSKGEEEAIGDAPDDSDAVIVPLAQVEMVHVFLQGIDPTLRNTLWNQTVRLFEGVAATIVTKVKGQDAAFGAALEHELKPNLRRLLTDYQEGLEQLIHNGYTVPVMDMVGALPKDELASMAESLVELTKFKRRVSRELETVGGPIDVAVITKGDGFVWVKRKHYFEPRLNLRHLASYLSGSTTLGTKGPSDDPTTVRDGS